MTYHLAFIHVDYLHVTVNVNVELLLGIEVARGPSLPVDGIIREPLSFVAVRSCEEMEL